MRNRKILSSYKDDCNDTISLERCLNNTDSYVYSLLIDDNNTYVEVEFKNKKEAEKFFKECLKELKDE